MKIITFYRFIVIFGAAVLGCCAPVWAAGHAALGVVAPGIPVPLELVYTNQGKTPLVLSGADIKTSCECLQPQPGPAQTVEPGGSIKLPFVYKGVNPGRVEIAVLIVSPGTDQVLDTTKVVGFVADPAWLVNPAELMDSKAAPAVVIDTRKAELYQQARLARSINLPLFAIKTRAELRTQPVVLVDGGFAPEVLLEEVKKLRALGFVNVRMLFGGVIGWSRHGGALEGTQATLRHELATLMPLEAMNASRTAAWEFVETDRAEEFFKVLAANPQATQPLVVIAGNPVAYAQIEARLAKGGARPVYYVQGGKAAWADFQAKQTALATNPHQVFQVKANSSRPVISGGCGSCGNK